MAKIARDAVPLAPAPTRARPRTPRSLALAVGFIVIAIVAMVGAVYYAVVNGGAR